MTKITKNSPYYYIPGVLKSYPEYAKLKLVDKALLDKDYDSLDVLFDAMENPYLIIAKASHMLDAQALKIIITKAKASDEGIEKLTQYCDFKKLVVDGSSSYDFTGEINSAEETAKASEVIKLILEFQNKDNISLKSLEIISRLVTKKEFEDFIKIKGIELTQDAFKGLDLTCYKFDRFEPLLLKKYSISYYILKHPTSGLLDLLLSRTHSDELTVDEVSNIYHKLYELSPISKEIITYTAALISKNNSIKIIFDKNIGTHYDPDQNIVQIDTAMFMKEVIFNIESVVIHELGHYIYEQLFKTGSRPFSFEELTKFIKQHKADINDPYMKESWAYKYFYNNSRAEEIKKILDEAMQYEQVARKPLEMAAKLLRMDYQEFDKYVDSNDIAEYFKDHSYIDLFYLSASKLSDGQYGNVGIDVFDNIHNIYLTEHSIYDVDNPLSPITMEGIVKWAVEEFLPNLVKKWHLSPTQIHFLERIADYVNRGTHLLSEKGRDEDDYERHVELTVRASELRAAGVEQEIIDSFQGLEQIHIQTASPKICEFIHTSDVASLSFDGEVSQMYVCLNVN